MDHSRLARVKRLKFCKQSGLFPRIWRAFNPRLASPHRQEEDIEEHDRQQNDSNHLAIPNTRIIPLVMLPLDSTNCTPLMAVVASYEP